MKIWYQSFARLVADARAKNYKDDLDVYTKTVARPGTQIDIHGTTRHAPGSLVNYSDYAQYLHVAQVIDNALQAEREGYDAFCVGGTCDLGHVYIREVLDIPVAFIAESSFYHACLMGRKFGIVSINEGVLRTQLELVKYHGLKQRCAGGVHVSSFGLTLAEGFDKDPKRSIGIFAEAARKVITLGASVVVPGYGGWCSFLGRQGVHDIDGVPIVDSVAVVIKTAELLVDLKNLGARRGRGAPPLYPAKEDLLAARKVYGVGQ